MSLLKLFRRPAVPEVDLRSVIGMADPVDWFQKAKLEKRTRYVLTQRDREIARGRAALEGEEVYPPKPRSRFACWQDEYADEVGVKASGPI